MSGPIVPPLTVSDVADGGAVTGRPITTLEVTSGTLSVSGRTATLATGGGGGSGTVTSITAAADSGTGTAITTSGTFTFTGSTGITTSVSGTTVTIVADNNGDVTAVATPVDNQLAVWTSATSIEGDANLTWDGSTLTVAGAVEFDNIKIDGNTISSTDTDGAIDLSPNGAGTVTMYNAYRFPTAVTSSNDYVLTAQTDGTTAWAEVTATVPDPLQLSAGSAAAPTYSFSGDTDTGMYLGGTNTLNLAGGGSDFLEMQHDGTATDFKVGTGSGNARITADGTNHLILQTNNGTNSGTITIQTAVNQDILIEPDGSGQISFYTGANAWTIENGQGSANQVLTTDGAGAATWEDAGGGGAGYQAVLPERVTGFPPSNREMYLISTMPPWGNINAGSTSSITAHSNPYYRPFISPVTGTVTTLVVNVNSDTDSPNYNIGIYSDNEGLPNALIASAAAAISATGTLDLTTFVGTPALIAGTQYHIAWVRTDASGAGNFTAEDPAYCFKYATASQTYPDLTSVGVTGVTVSESGTSNTLPATVTVANLAPFTNAPLRFGLRWD